MFLPQHHILHSLGDMGDKIAWESSITQAKDYPLPYEQDFMGWNTSFKEVYEYKATINQENMAWQSGIINIEIEDYVGE